MSSGYLIILNVIVYMHIYELNIGIFLAFILEHKDNFSKNIIDTYKIRNKDKNNLLDEANIEHQIYETCFLISRKNKVTDYWINIWGQAINYKDSTLIEHLLL